MGEARDLIHAYHNHLRKSGQQEASAWVRRAFLVTRRRFGEDGLGRVKVFMREIEREEMCL